jgi:hypothetical protein
VVGDGFISAIANSNDSNGNRILSRSSRFDTKWQYGPIDRIDFENISTEDENGSTDGVLAYRKSFLYNSNYYARRSIV